MKTIPLKLSPCSSWQGFSCTRPSPLKEPATGCFYGSTWCFPRCFRFSWPPAWSRPWMPSPCSCAPSALSYGRFSAWGDAGCYTFLTGLLCGYPSCRRQKRRKFRLGRASHKERGRLSSVYQRLPEPHVRLRLRAAEYESRNQFSRRVLGSVSRRFPSP